MFEISKEPSLDDVLVVLMVKSFEERSNSYLGRTAIQKLCYFAKVLGAPLSHRFRIHYYGPYSEELASTIDRLLAAGVLEDKSLDRSRYSNLRLGPQASQMLEVVQHAATDNKETVDQVARALARLDPSVLELLSTLHFVDQRLKAMGFASVDKDRLLAEFRSFKGEKFGAEQIEQAYAAMKEVRLIA